MDYVRHGDLDEREQRACDLVMDELVRAVHGHPSDRAALGRKHLEGEELFKIEGPIHAYLVATR